jgi:hypothetical protein
MSALCWYFIIGEQGSNKQNRVDSRDQNETLVTQHWGCEMLTLLECNGTVCSSVILLGILAKFVDSTSQFYVITGQ